MFLRTIPALMCLSLLTGCGIADFTASGPETMALQLGGKVHGGNQPMNGAVVQLWQVGTTGYGSAPTALGSSTTTDANGNFTLTGAYSCPTGSTLVYLTGTGGNPGLTSGTNNSASVLLLALGACGSLSSAKTVVVNEVTTVASVYALAQFMNSTGGIGSYASSPAGLNLAFANVNNLISPATGFALNAPINSSLASVFPVTTLNTLANILVPCVNSAGPASAACVALFAAAPSANSTILTAALSIATNPGQNQQPLFNLAASNPAFQPTLSVKPNDWTVSLGFNLGAATMPTAITIDPQGNIWSANYNTGVTSSTVSQMSNSGVPASNSPFGGIYAWGAYGIAFDQNGDCWITGKDLNTVVQFDIENANAITNVGYHGASTYGINAPEGIAIDASRTLWIADSGNNSVTSVGVNTSVVTQYTGGGLSSPFGVAVDSNNNAWITNSGNGSLTYIPKSGGANSPTQFSGGGLTQPLGIAVDAGNNLWAGDTTLSETSELNNLGAAISGSNGFSGGGITNSFAIAIDGASTVWTANFNGSSISSMNQAGTATSPSTGFLGGLGSPHALAIDASGNIWVGNTAPVNSNTITEFIGLAAPANMPLTIAIQNGGVGKRPGTLAVMPTTVPSEAHGSFFTKNFAGIGGNTAYTWAITTGQAALTAVGVNMNSNGLFFGTPTTPGSYPFTVTVTDSTGNTATASYTLVVT